MKKLISLFAKLEGIELELFNDVYFYKDANGADVIYNPIADFALNCKARDEYGAEVKYEIGHVLVADSDGCNGILTNHKNINSAVIECILKSKGLL